MGGLAAILRRAPREDVTPLPPKDRLEFEQTVDGIFRGALGAFGDPSLVEALKAAGLDLTRKLAPAYRPEDVYLWMRVAARHAFPALSEEEGCRRVGQLSVERGMRSTLHGRAVLHFLKLVGVRRSLLVLQSAFRHGNNYIEAKATDVGERAMEVHLGPLVGPVTYFEGVLEAGPKQMGAREVQVTRLRTEGEFVTFRVEWTE